MNNEMKEREYMAFFSSEELPQNIADWWINIPQKVLIGYGRHSTAYLITTSTHTKYIVRTTHVVGLHERQMLHHEISIYERLKRNPAFLNHVSELLYADFPTKYHGIDRYDQAYFIFRYVEGLPMDTLINSFIKTNQNQKNQNKKSYLTLAKLKDWGGQLLGILDFLNANTIVHRDIKPANLFVDTTHDCLVVFDFGSACVQGDCKSYTFHGTRAYASPESHKLLEHFPKAYEYSARDDRYSVEVILKKDLLSIVEPDSIAQYQLVLQELGF